MNERLKQNDSMQPVSTFTLDHISNGIVYLNMKYEILFNLIKISLIIIIAFSE